MADAIKPLGAQISFTTANTVGLARNVRIFASAVTLVTVTDAANVTLGSFIMPANTVEVLYKSSTDKIVANVAISCTPVGYR